MTDKPLEFKHAHITGQAMRDHWGPIVDRIAAETADWRDEWIYDLITENERLRDTPNRIWAEARDSEWDEGFNYAVKLFRAALGDTK